MKKIMDKVMNTTLEDLKEQEHDLYKQWSQARLYVQMKEISLNLKEEEE